MRNKNFSWGNFSIGFLKAVLYGPHTNRGMKPGRDMNEVDFLVPYMDMICVAPDKVFVRRYRTEIEEQFLNETAHGVSVVTKLTKHHYGGITLDQQENLVEQLKGKRMTETLCNAYLEELKVAGRNIPESLDNFFSYPKTIDLAKAKLMNLSMFPYQEEAVDQMRTYFMDQDNKSAVLVMPTGSGKTRTCVNFILRDMISQGYQIIWLAHRSMLIDQAAEQFYTCAPIIKEKNSDMELFKMVCISGTHANIRALEKDDNLIISSVQSVCNNTQYLTSALGEKVMVVVDEGHHSLAPSYRRVIREIRKSRPQAKTVGTDSNTGTDDRSGNKVINGDL